MDDKYTVLFRRDGRFYVALCLELNVASQGESPDEARRNIADAIEEYSSYVRDEGLAHEVQPVPFDLLREFLLEEIDETGHGDIVRL